MIKVKEYRQFIGVTQKEMAELIGLSETQYRAKEKMKYEFTRSEMSKIYFIVRNTIPNLTYEDIFFLDETDENRRKGGEHNAIETRR